MTIVPADWVVDTPDQAAQRLLMLTDNIDHYHAARSAAQDWVVSRYDWSVIRPRFDELLLSAAEESSPVDAKPDATVTSVASRSAPARTSSQPHPKVGP
jgi:hypothetical protein